ncbi:MAG: hypothetical protein KAW01_03475, partial [Deltaproteobacteria bacterium]|nr:hypothetical protein [Deltaproteobacteria bacterium]
DFNDTFTPPAIIPATLDEQKTIKEAFDDHQPVTPPTGVQIYTFSPVENPDILDFYHVSTPSKIKPIGIGNIVTGGNTMNISFDVPNFTEPMNIYFAVVIQALPNDLFLYGADKSWHHYNTEGLIAAIENKTWSSKVTTLENIDITVLPETTFNLFLVAAKGADLSNAYIWNTSYEVDKTGTVTGNPLQCVNTLESELIPLIDAMEKKGTQEWYDKAKQYVESYRDEDGNSSPGEAYSLLMWAAYLSDNIYPFCWASFNGLLIDPDDPMFLNSTVVGLFELGKIDLAGRFLDCTIKVAPEFPLTWDNVAFYYNSKGDAPNAIKAKEKAVGAVGNDEHPHAAWDGYHYAKSKGLDSAAASFDQNIPSNYGLLKADGSVGAGKPILRVCCSCNGKFFNDVNACVGDCPASLGCFTNICTPNVMCCDLNGVFSVEGGLCYPPGGAQVCIEVDHNGNATLKAGADILFIEAYAGATTNFKNKHSVFIEAKALGQKAKGYVYNSDPHAKMVETTFSPSIDWDSKMVGRKFGVSFGANFDHGKILRSIICAAQN